MMQRRTLLGLAGASAAVAALGPTAIAAAGRAEPPDLDDEQQLARAFRKLAYSLDETVMFWWMRGTRYGVVDSFATPFWDMYVGAWFTTHDLADDRYAVTMASANFYTPPNSTDLLEVFRNPYTGADVPIGYPPAKSRRTVMGREGGSAFGGDIQGMKSSHRDAIGPGWIEADDVVIRGDMVLHAEPSDPASDFAPLHVNDWSTYVGRLADVMDPAMKSTPAAQYFNDILIWPQWLKMGEQSGSYVSRCFGRKVRSVEHMPKTWQKLFAQAMPEAAKDPLAILEVS